MSRDLADENYYVSHGGLIPVKWTAPEVIIHFILHQFGNESHIYILTLDFESNI